MGNFGGAVGQIVSQPQAKRAVDASFLKDFVDEAICSYRIKSFADVKSKEEMVMVSGPRVVGFLDHSCDLFFSRPTRAEPALIGWE